MKEDDLVAIRLRDVLVSGKGGSAEMHERHVYTVKCIQ